MKLGFPTAPLRRLLTGCLFLLSALAQPHQFQWVRQFGPAAGPDTDLPAVAASSPGMHVVAGRLSGALPGQSSAGDNDVYVRAYDDSGNVLWTRQFGSSANDFATGLAIDSSGNVILAGTACAALPGQSSAGGCDAFIRKFDSSGATSWTRQLGTAVDEFAARLAVDSAGNIVLTGATRGSFPGFTLSGFTDAFIARYDPAGNQLWLTQFGTPGSDTADAVAIDAAGSIFVGGSVEGSLNSQPVIGGGDAFLMKLTAAGATQWTVQYGTAGFDRCADIALSPAGAIYTILTGSVSQMRAFTAAGAVLTAIGNGAPMTAIAADATGFSITGFTQFSLPGKTNAGGNDAYIRRFNHSFVEQWNDLIGTKDGEQGLAVSANGASVFLAGITSGILPGKSPGGSNDSFVRKYSLAGAEAWTGQFTSFGPANSLGTAVFATATRVYTAGHTSGAMPGQSSAGNNDVFLSAHDLNGNLLWLRQFGTASYDSALALTVDPAGNIYVGGNTGGVFPGATPTGNFDAFLRKFDATGAELWTRQFGAPAANVQINGLTVDAAGAVYLAGTTSAALPGQSSAGASDAFVRKYSPLGDELWTRQLGTSSSDNGNAIALDSTGGVILAGFTAGGTFPGQVKVGVADGFLARLDAAGNPTWFSQIGVAAGQIANFNTIAVAPDGTIYVGGTNTGAYPGQVSQSGGFDASLLKLSPTGAFQWARQFGASGSNRAAGIALDAAANVSLIGSISNNFISETFIARFNPAGTALGFLLHSTPNNEFTTAGAGNADGLLFATGYTPSAFPGLTQSGANDVFVKKFLPPNNLPVVTAAASSVAVNEGALAANTGTFSDLDPGDTVTLFASAGTITKTGPAAWAWSAAAVEGPAALPVTITAIDSRGGVATVTFQVVVANLPPVLGAATGPTAAVAKNASVTIAAPVSDPGILDPITCRFQWADGTADTVKPAATGACSAAHTYANAGVYPVTIIAADDDGGSVSTTFTAVVVYDPNAGFLTGGGWIQDTAGKANFSFEIKNESGGDDDDDDDDDSELNFQSGNLRFCGTSHQWLVISGARAQAKGAGRLNGASGYTYLLSVVDGKVPAGGGVDKFRLKIWKNATPATPQTLIYDNVPGAPDTFLAANPQPLGGGNITIHTKEKHD